MKRIAPQTGRRAYWRRIILVVFLRVLGIVDEPFEGWGGTSPAHLFDSLQFVLVRKQRVGAQFGAMSWGAIRRDELGR